MQGRLELGTLGRGNHFLELQTDDAGALWLMLHSGSRAMGQAIRDHHLRGARRGATGLSYLDTDEEAGQAYLADLDWALRYADASRRVMAEVTAALLDEILGAVADWSTWLSCHHNHVRRETHDGGARWVHRKGAIPAADDEPGIIPGSMGTPSFHTRGRGHGPALCSSSHGAGRALSRTVARQTISRRDLLRQLDGVLYDHRRADQLRDEAPAAYKNIRAVPAAGNQPPIWLLGSSDYSAQLAGALGLPFAFAHHFSKEQTLPALRAYRACFKPSDVLKKPYAMVAALAVLADSDREAERLALPNALAFLRLRRGEPGLYPTVAEAEAHPWTPMELEFAADRMDGNLVGGPQRARAQVEKLLSDTLADELMLLCAVPDHAARKRSYTLLRQIQNA